MRQFNKLKTIDTKAESELIDTFLFQALKDTGFDYYYNYQAYPSKNNQFHGKIDYLIYNKNSDGNLPLIPVIQYQKVLNKTINQYEYADPTYYAVGVGLWALNNMRAFNDKIDTVYVISTNGNKWRLYKMGIDGSFEKTVEYYAKNDQHKKIYRDQEAQSLALGLIRFSLNQREEKEVALKKIYDFIDERRYLTEKDPISAQRLQRQQKFWWFLPKKLREYLFPIN